jgi:hypothetical protein
VLVEARIGEAGDAEEGFGDGGAPSRDVALLGFFVEGGEGAEDVGAEAEERGALVRGFQGLSGGGEAGMVV